jgi:putative redox protein
MANEITVAIRQTSPAASEAAIRQHRVLIDRPEDKGGTDAGPMGGELFLAAIGGCFMSNLLAAMRARNVTMEGVHTRVTGRLADDAPARFVAVELLVSADSGDGETLGHLVAIADKGCIMMNTLRDRLDVRVRVEEGETGSALSRSA